MYSINEVNFKIEKVSDKVNTKEKIVMVKNKKSPTVIHIKDKLYSVEKKDAQ